MLLVVRAKTSPDDVVPGPTPALDPDAGLSTLLFIFVMRFTGPKSVCVCRVGPMWIDACDLSLVFLLVVLLLDGRL